MSGCLSEKSPTSNQISRQHGLTRHSYQIGETKGVIITDHSASIEAALDCIEEQRRQLFEYIRDNPDFEYSLEPLDVVEAPDVVRLMAEASKAAGVGPMAAVAGVIADLAAQTMIMNNASVAVVENGGEAALYSDRPIIISVGAGNNLLSERFGFKVTRFPCGVATSSGRHSHAFSMGDADTVTVFADNAGLADAAATAAANRVIGEPGTDVKTGVDEALAIRDEQVSTGGVLPQMIHVEAIHMVSLVGGDASKSHVLKDTVDRIASIGGIIHSVEACDNSLCVCFTHDALITLKALHELVSRYGLKAISLKENLRLVTIQGRNIDQVKARIPELLLDQRVHRVYADSVKVTLAVEQAFVDEVSSLF